jgi:hypothetical protein
MSSKIDASANVNLSTKIHQNHPEHNDETVLAKQQIESLAEANDIVLDDYWKHHSIAELTLRDLDAMVDILHRYHPAAVDTVKTHSVFQKWLTAGYSQAANKAKQATSFEGYRFALESFIAGFKDGHLRFYTLERPTVLWPGFLIAYRNEKYVIVQSDEHSNPSQLPPDGAEVLACNGKPPFELFSANLLPYMVDDPEVESTRVRLTPKLLIDEGNPWTEKIKTITVRQTDGVEVTYPLNWVESNRRAIEPQLAAATYGNTPEFCIKEFGEKGVWISIPTFSNRLGGDQALPELVKRLPHLRDKDSLVFDLRGNGGGSSRWVVDILFALYGKDYLSTLEIKNCHSLADDRISAELIKMKEKSSPKEHLARMQSALEAGEPFLRRPTDVNVFSQLQKMDTDVQNPVKGQVYLLTDGRCFSTALIFADSILSIPGVTHIGMTTNADTEFSMPTPLRLPSGLSQICCPTMIRRNWERANNKPYVPKIKYHDFIGDNAAVEKWISQLCILPLSKRSKSSSN